MKKLFFSLLVVLIFAPTTWAAFPYPTPNDQFKPNEHNYYHPDGPNGSFPDHYPSPNQDFHPQSANYYQSDNQRLQLKNRADIERASKSTVHYDQEAADYYRCDWQYEKAIGTWVCNKDVVGTSNANYYANNYQNNKVTSCSFGYQPNPWQTGCDRIQVPLNATLNSTGDGWDCITGFRKNGAYNGCVPLVNEVVYQPTTIYVQPVNTVKYVYVDDQPTVTKKPVRLAATGPGVGVLLSSLASLLGFKLIKKLA